MSEEQENASGEQSFADIEPCNIDDIVCQAGILKNLRELQQGLGIEGFRTRFPEFEGMDTKLSDEIQSQIGTLRDSITRCGNIEESDINTERD